MAFPYFPASYQQAVNPYQMQMQQMAAMQQQPQQSSGIIWVQGIEAMKSYPVAAGQSVLLMDSESNCFGIKTADASGMPMPLRIFDYVERKTSPEQRREPQSASVDLSAYVTREELEARIAQLSASQSQPKRTAKKESESNGE